VTYRRQDFWIGNNASSPAPEWDLEIIVIWNKEDRPHHWVTPFLGKRGQIGLSRHNFASTAPFLDLSTPL